MSGSQPCKHAWLQGREMVSASVSRRVLSTIFEASRLAFSAYHFITHFITPSCIRKGKVLFCVSFVILYFSLYGFKSV